MDHGFRDQIMQGGGPRGGGGWRGVEDGLSSGFGWWFGICLTLLTLALITLLVFYLLQWFRTRGASDGSIAAANAAQDSDATAVLDRRLATGEIGPDDYTRRMAVLGSRPPKDA